VKTKKALMRLYCFSVVFFSSRMFGFYGYLPIGLYEETFAHLMVFGVSAVVAVLLLLFHNGKLKYSVRHLWWYLSIYLIIAFEIVNTHFIAMNQSAVLTMTEVLPYLNIPMVSFVLMSVITDEEDFQWFLSLFWKSALILSLFSCIQFLLYDSIRIFPLANVIYRNGRPRIFIGGNVVFCAGYLITMWKLFFRDNRRSRWLLVTALMLGAFRVYVVEHQRAMTMIMAVVLILCLIHRTFRNKYLRVLIYLFLVLAVVVFSLVSEISIPMTNNNTVDFSIYARLNSYKFFLEKAKQYPWLGMGFITSSKNQDYLSYSLLNNSTGYHCERSDVGIVGLLNMWGIVGVIWYLVYLYYLFRLSKKTSSGENSLIFFLFGYAVLTSVTLILTDPQRTLLMVLFYVIACKYWKFEKKHGGY